MAALSSGQMSYLLDEVVSAVFINEFTQLPQVMGALYNIRTSSKARERSSSMSGLGLFTQKPELQAVDIDIPIQQFQKTFNHTPFGKQTPVSRELIDDEDWGFFEDLGVQFAVAANRTMETDAAAVFNDAFDGATYKGEDDKSLCHTAHVNVDDGNSTSNKGTNTLSHSGIKATRLAMRGFTDYRGQKISVNPDTIITPPDLEEDAWEIINSSQITGSANNNANFYQGRFSLVVWNYLTDTNDWFMTDSMMQRMNLIWYFRTGLEIFGDGDLFTGTRSIGAYYRKSNGFRDWRWIYGNEQA